MKIVCDNCATKYSIADEKVRGKVFKIRCKKCSHIIVVRGNDGASTPADAARDGAAESFPADEPATVASRNGGGAAPLGSGDAVWHLVIDREQIGPLTVQEVRDKFSAGEIDVETYAWREGFADWLRLGSIDDFKDLGASAPARAVPGPSKQEGPTRRTETADLFATAAPAEEPAAEAGDLFGGGNAPGGPAGEAPVPANDLFGGGQAGLFSAPAAAAPAAAAAPRAARGAAVQPASEAAAPMAAAAASGDVKMTGQRNESSVLFSLNNLQALAGGGGAAPANKPAAGEAARPGFANSQTEGSGLIDIRAMAASTLASSPSGSSARAEEPSFASAPLFSPMAAPILMPAAPSGPPKWIWALLGVGVLAVLGIVIVGVLLLTKKPEPVIIAAAPPVAPVAAAPVPGAPAPAAGAAPAAAAPAAAAAPEPAKADEGDKGHKKGGKGGAKAGHGAAAAPGAPAAAPSAPAPSEAPKKGSGGKKDALDDLLNQASPDKPAPRRSAPEPSASAGGGDLPDQLDKTAIVGGMSKIKGRVAGCYDQYKVPGLANVSVTIGKSGRVSAASVSGSFAGTPTGECVERVVKSASFPPFKGSPQTINYPFMLR